VVFPNGAAASGGSGMGLEREARLGVPQ
jgi:hypothetical protein